MLPDFKMIVHKFPMDVPYINIYPVGDVHVGSKECNLDLFVKLTKMVESNPYSYMVIVGDMMNMGLKTSKSNVYEEIMSPAEQKEYCYEALYPIRHKILAGCSGNHENRNVREVGTNPLYDVFCRLQIEDVYRENACFMKISLGRNHSDARRQITYGVTCTHGKRSNRDIRWTYAVDNCDLFISGHTHLGTHQPMAKIHMDLQTETVKTVGYQQITVIPFQEYGGYAIRDKHLPTHLEQFQVITLSGDTKHVSYTLD